MAASTNTVSGRIRTAKEKRNGKREIKREKERVHTHTQRETDRHRHTHTHTEREREREREKSLIDVSKKKNPPKHLPSQGTTSGAPMVCTPQVKSSPLSKWSLEITPSSASRSIQRVDASVTKSRK